MAAERAWWQDAVIYQIYPRSFMDAWTGCPRRARGGARPGEPCGCGGRHPVGDGIGDLQGIIDRLDYLNNGSDRSLGVDAIWLSPTYPSPMKDFGYDISDYCDVHPDFGDLATMDRLIAECHRRGIRLLLDWVPNHTSDQHPWFLESRRDRVNPRRDWYIWRAPKPGGGPPNNWLATFGGSMWEWSAATGQYYQHSFLTEQPDLNWRNPGLVAAMDDTLRFWLRRGVDGFRIDAISMMLKDRDLRDNPPNPDPEAARTWGEAWSQLHIYDRNQPEVFEAMRHIRRVLDEFPGRMAVGEASADPEILPHYYGGDRLDGLHMAFNFHLIRVDRDTGNTPWQAPVIRAVVDQSEAGLPVGAWPNWVLGNHDVSRFISRHNHDGQGTARARAAALLLFTLRGTPFIYYGEELGMEDVPVPEDRARDPARFRAFGRDPARTPMPWHGGAGRGFSTGEPWLPFGHAAINVAAQDGDPDSLLSLYRRLVWFRKRSAALKWGAYRPLAATPEPVFAFLREASGERLLTAINFAGEEQVWEPGPDIRPVRILLSTAAQRPAAVGGSIRLMPHEGILMALG